MHMQTIKNIANRLETSQADDASALMEAATYIEKLEKALSIYEKERVRFKHANPEFTGAFFIAGESGDKDANYLPEYIHVCPAYGCDWSQVYVKTDRISR